MLSNVVLNKVETIQRCINRIKEEYEDNKQLFLSDLTKQDSVILNLERASQATIDIATHIIKVKKLGIPNSSRELFEILERYDIISQESAYNMKAMVGFRNIAVHDYQNLNLEIVISIIENHLHDFELFIQEILD